MESHTGQTGRSDPLWRLTPRHRLALGLSLIVLAALWLGWRWYGPVPAPTTPPLRYDITRTISYSFTLKNTTNRVLEQVEFWTYAPVRQTSSQQCCVHLDVSQPYRLEQDSWGNQLLHFQLTDWPPYSSRIIRIKAELRLADNANPLPESRLAAFLGPERFIESDAPPLRTLAAQLADQQPAITARNIYEWVASHIRYAGYLREDRGALYAFQKQQGDCTEYMDLFIALARANGIPARAVGGYVYDQDAVLKPNDYHNWAEFYVDGAWRLADPQKRRFGERPSRYLAMRLITADATTPQTHRFWYRGEGLHITMN
jgi:transglutaminase-like putative cysteine protease